MILTTYCGNTGLKTIRINTTTGGERIDVFLAANISGLTRNALQKLIEDGQVSLNGIPVRKSHKTSPGEIYTVIQNEPSEPETAAQAIPLVIIFEDDDVIVVYKPRGMVVHPAPGHPDGTLVNALLHHCGGSLSGIGGIRRPGIVHRIDKDTSGLVIAAKTDHAHNALMTQLSSRTLTREYEAVICGKVKNDSGTIDAPIGRHQTDRKRQAVHLPSERKSPYNVPSARSAVTHYSVIARYNGYTHIRCKLETGRTHQIRVHLAHIGYPVLGDLVYGRKKPELGMSGQCLHAQLLRFIHPVSGDPIEVSADLPEYFTEVLRKLEAKSV